MAMPSPATVPAPSVTGPDVASIVTEDDTPVDNVYSEKQQRLLSEPLYSGWSGPPPEEGATPRTFVVMANVGVFTTPRLPPVVPDVLVSLDVQLPGEVHTKEHRTYFAWEYGKVPDVVIEVVSNREGGELTDRKRRYRQMLVPYYVVWDPERHLGSVDLQSFELRGHLYVRMDRPHFEGLGLGLTVWPGTYERLEDRWLRWCDAAGALIPTGAERAEHERERAERLAEKLRSLGVDPDA